VELYFDRDRRWGVKTVCEKMDSPLHLTEATTSASTWRCRISKAPFRVGHVHLKVGDNTEQGLVSSFHAPDTVGFTVTSHMPSALAFRVHQQVSPSSHRHEHLGKPLRMPDGAWETVGLVVSRFR